MLRMATDLDHLPNRIQRELGIVQEVLFDEFGKGIANGTQIWKRKGRILKVILFGSFARGNQVEDRKSGYTSDFDIFVVLNYGQLITHTEIWWTVEERLMKDRRISHEVNIVTETLKETNYRLDQGFFFFKDIVTEGIALYEQKGYTLHEPALPESARERRKIAKEHYDIWMPAAQVALKGAKFYFEEGHLKDSAFTLHQAVERFYTGVLLVKSNYRPNTHNIKFLRSLSENYAPELVTAWPRILRRDKRLFELLKRAYVEARYSPKFKVSREEIDWLTTRVKALLGMSETVRP